MLAAHRLTSNVEHRLTTDDRRPLVNKVTSTSNDQSMNELTNCFSDVS